MFHSETPQPRMKGLMLKNFHNLVELVSPQKMIWKHSLSAFRSKHFKHREPNDANTVSVFNCVALKNPMIFFKFSKLLYTVVGSFDKNQLERR